MYKLYGFFDLEQIDESTCSRWLERLPRQRREKALRYRKESDRKLSVASYLLLMHGLKDRFGLQFPRVETGENGKPFLPEHPDIHFNISHCEKGCICAVSDCPIGVDIQQIRSVSPAVINRCCSEKEKLLLRQAADPAVVFTRMWAMKESYLKMTGKGIATDLTAVDTAGAFAWISAWEEEGCFVAVAEEGQGYKLQK